MKKSVVSEKSKSFAVRIIKLSQYLVSEKREYVLSHQILKSGTSIGANLREAEFAQSKKDFISKVSIALKEAAESEYWLELLYNAEYISKQEFDNLYCECNEINRLLITIVKTSKNRQ